MVKLKLTPICVDDFGNLINPMIVEGQIHGGLAQGLVKLYMKMHIMMKLVN